MKKSNYEFDIVVNGKPLKEYYHCEDTLNCKNYIEGKKNTEFSLRIKNNGSERILAIPSIDGLSVMDGKNASFDSSGYIINRYDSLTIDGWRTSDREVAKFYFSNSEDSYGKRKGDGNNLGIIGMAVFTEKETKANQFKEFMDKMNDIERKPCLPYIPYIPPIEIHPCPDHHRCPSKCPWDTTSTPIATWDVNTTIYSNGSSAIGGSQIMNLSASNNTRGLESVMDVSMVAQEQEIGTGWGESKRSEVTSVEFKREDKASATFEIYYNTRKQLEKIGIDFTKKPVYITPQAFPGQYCEPPKN